MVSGILGLSAGQCDNGPSFRMSAARFFLQFSLQFSLEKALFGRFLAQLILAALPLYPFGVKEGGLFPAHPGPGFWPPGASWIRFWRLGASWVGFWRRGPPGARSLPAGVCPRKFFTIQGFVCAICAFGPKQLNERTYKQTKGTNEHTNRQANK